MLFLAIVALPVVAAAFFILLQSFVRQRRQKAQLADQLAKITKELKDSEQGRQMMFSANSYPMWVYDCETLRFLEVNDAAVRTYGYSRDEFLAMTLVDIRPPHDTEAFLEVASERHKGYNTAGVWRHRRKDGSILLSLRSGPSSSREKAVRRS